jgi:alanine-glyoxylate transaminase/serine-glyoxylate transaminase/serine-pyruvate transaminase
MLLGPGPTNVHPRVLRAMSTPITGYLDSAYFEILDEISDMLQIVYQTRQNTMVVAASGSGGMEAGLNSLIERGDKVIMCAYGHFCDRMIEMAERLGANVITVRSTMGRAMDPALLVDAIAANPDVKLVTAIHAETSAGVLQPLTEISRLTHDAGALLMVDMVTSLAGAEVRFDDWSIDYAYSGPQKCLAGPPGVSPVAVSDAALAYVRNRATKPSSWYLDIDLIAQYWGPDHAHHHTSPISMMFGLREALAMALEEGIDNRIQRHAHTAAGLRAGLTALGLNLPVPADERLDQLTVIEVPAGIDDNAVRQQILDEYAIEIGRGLGEFRGNKWRIGLMGESCQPQNVLAVLAAFERVLPHHGFEVAAGAGVAAASVELGKHEILVP